MHWPTVTKHALYLAVIAAGGAFAALQHAEPGVAWIGVVVAICGGVGNMLTDSPSTAARIRNLELAVAAADRLHGKGPT